MPLPIVREKLGQGQCHSTKPIFLLCLRPKNGQSTLT